MPDPTGHAALRQKGRKVELFQKLLGVKDHEGNRIETSELKQLYKKTLAIAWPSTVEGALISIISSVDTMMVGTLGAASIAAVGLTAQPRMILLICAQALCIGTTALCSRRKGANDQAASTGKFMNYFFPLFSLVICLGYSSAFALYWVAGNLVMMVQTLLINKYLDNKEKQAAAVAGEGTIK